MQLARLTTLHPAEPATDLIQVWVLGNQFGVDQTPLQNVIGKRAHATALTDFLNSLLRKSFTVQVSYWTDTDMGNSVTAWTDPLSIYSSVAGNGSGVAR
jgi:hypothetical protein